MPITKKAKYPDKPIGKDAELLQLFEEKCAARQKPTSTKLEGNGWLVRQLLRILK
jgi:hypothetical protein